MTKQRCRALRELGYSIGQIARLVKRSESTVHWHVRDIGLTAAQRERLGIQKRERMTRINAKRRGIPLNPKQD